MVSMMAVMTMMNQMAVVAVMPVMKGHDMMERGVYIARIDRLDETQRQNHTTNEELVDRKAHV